jgi:hypothetical protein
VTVVVGGGLSGNGIITGNVHMSGVVSPGDTHLTNGARSAGDLDLRGNVDFHTGTTLAIDIFGLSGGSGYDVLNMSRGNGTLSITGNVGINLNIDPERVTITAGDPVLLNGAAFTIIDTNHPIIGALTATYDFYGHPTMIGGDIVYEYDPALHMDPSIFRLVLTDSGNDLTLISVPEPGAASSLACGVGLLLGLQRFRRRARTS